MKLLYGVVGEGMGHAMRSRVVLEHLVAEGHDVEVMASQRAVDYLARRFDKVRRIHGLHIIYEENRVRRGKTLWTNVRDGLAALPSQVRAYFELIDRFEPGAVITDFESWTYLYARAHRLPLYSVDNMQVINRCRHPKDLLDVDRAGYEVARAFVKAKVPFCDHYFVTTFFDAPARKPRTTLYPPILRPEILSARAERGGHLLVYQTAEGHGELARVLGRSGLECRIYGMRRGITEEQLEGKLRYRPFSETAFIEDLATARGVIAGGGFTLMSECVYLHKPLLANPVGGQFEQVLNALHLQKLGYGRHAAVLDERAVVEFIEAAPDCEERLGAYHQAGNRLLQGALDAHLDRAAAGLSRSARRAPLAD